MSVNGKATVPNISHHIIMLPAVIRISFEIVNNVYFLD